MSRTFGLTLAASVVALGLAATPSLATANPPSTFVFGSGTHSANFTGTTTANFTDAFTLILLVNGDSSFGFNSSFTGRESSTTFTSFSLTQGTKTLGSGDITYSTSTKGGKVRTGATGSFSIEDLAAGTYSLLLSGTSKAATAYSGTISVSSVPLPPALPMFGAALLGLGGLGYSVKRKSGQKLAVAEA